MRLGVFLPNWVGDVVMATPALRALRSYVGPEGQLVGVMRPYVAEVLAGTTWLDETLLYEKRPTRDDRRGSSVCQRLRELDLDAVLLLTNSLRTGWMAWRSGAPRRVGYARNLRTWLLTTKVYEPHKPGQKFGLPPIESYLHLASAVGCPCETPHMELKTTQADEQLAEAVWKRVGLDSSDRVVVFNSGGAFGGAKHWPAEHFASLARRLVTNYGLSVLVNCGPSERTIARSIVSQANDDRVVSLADEESLPIGLTKACIRRARLLVTTDSGPRYFGIAFGRPVITLFGPTDAATTCTNYDWETCLSLSLECQPCWKRTCPLGHHRCMNDLTVDLVYATATKYLSESKFTCRAEQRSGDKVKDWDTTSADSQLTREDHAVAREMPTGDLADQTLEVVQSPLSHSG